jgi:hypothetical protein
MKSRIDVQESLAPAARTATASGSAVDLANFDAATVVFHPGTVTDGVHTPVVQESADGSTGWSDVAASDLTGALAALASNTIQRVGYIGNKRFIRARVGVTGGPATGAAVAASVIRGHARYEPLA